MDQLYPVLSAGPSVVRLSRRFQADCMCTQTHRLQELTGWDSSSHSRNSNSPTTTWTLSDMSVMNPIKLLLINIIKLSTGLQLSWIELNMEQGFCGFLKGLNSPFHKIRLRKVINQSRKSCMLLAFSILSCFYKTKQISKDS